MGINACIYFKMQTPFDSDLLNKQFEWAFGDSAYARPYVTKRYFIENPDVDNIYWVNTDCARYYSVGYERGPILEIVTLIEWIRNKLPQAEIYYSGDCYDIENYPLWTREDSIKILNHFWNVGYGPYNNTGKEALERE